MGYRYINWRQRGESFPRTLIEVESGLKERCHLDPEISLNYGDYGLSEVQEAVLDAIKQGKKIALYADYDVDGTMSCVSWIWFLEAISYKNYTYYIPDRFKEGYGLNLVAVKRLALEEGAELIITMDCGITANEEAAWCKENNIGFVCTDHHKINPATMPDCLILNPVLHPDPDYQFMCGCGITYVLLRKIGKSFSCSESLWYDLLALAGLATICDIVPLNSVNHKLARLGIKALTQSKRPVLVDLLKEAMDGKTEGLSEQDLGFKIGPRINAVGRLDHGQKIVNAFVGEASQDLVSYMAECNEERKQIQEEIYREAFPLAEAQSHNSIIFIGGDWHIGVIGIVASKLVDHFWKPVWIYSTKDQSLWKGSARSISGFDVTSAMSSCGELFKKYGGHAAAGGFSFECSKAKGISQALCSYADEQKETHEALWTSEAQYDFPLSLSLLDHSLLDVLDRLRPFGHKFPEPVFKIEAVVTHWKFYCDKTTGEKKHTCVFIRSERGKSLKILFFNVVYDFFETGKVSEFLVTVQKNYWRSQISLSLFGVDCSV